MFTDEQIKRFWSHVSIKGSNECWNWKLGTDRYGYGKVKVAGKVTISHRVAYKISKGDIPGSTQVLHSCDNRICCNPVHLWTGTHDDNMKDMFSKGRQGKGYSFRKQLNSEKAENLRADFGSGISKRALAKKYSITPRHVRAILRGIYWNDTSPTPPVNVVEE